MATETVSAEHSDLFQQDASPEEFLQSLSWRKQADPRLVAAAKSGDVVEFTHRLQNTALPLQQPLALCGSTEGVFLAYPSLWSVEPSDANDALVELRRIVKWFSKIEQKADRRKKPTAIAKQKPWQAACRDLEDWLEAAEAPNETAPDQLLLLWDLLERLRKRVDETVYFALWRRTLLLARWLRQEVDFLELSETPRPRDIVIRGEVFFRAGLWFGDLQEMKSLQRHGQKFLNHALDALTDTDGTPHASLMEHWEEWLAALLRSDRAAGQAGVGLWKNSHDERMQSLLCTLTAMCRRDGNLFSQNGEATKRPSLLLAGVNRKLDRQTNTAYSALQQLVDQNSETDAAQNKILHSKKTLPSYQSDWGHLACLRNNWTPEANRLVVTHEGSWPVLDFAARGRLAAIGPWSLQLKRDGRPIPCEPTWECVCWFSDEEVDYLELQATVEDGIQIDRQLLLPRNQHFLLLADAVQSDRDSHWEFESHLPLVDGAVVTPDASSRECTIKAGKQKIRAFPLALWPQRSQELDGSLTEEDGQLILRQTGEGKGLYAPLILDWEPRFKKRPVVWRTLTVSEDRQVSPRDHAASFRLQIGRHHLLVYRSLKKARVPRAVLGFQTSHESVIGRFDSAGDVYPLVQVEQ